MEFKQFYNKFNLINDIGNAGIELKGFEVIDDDFRSCIKELGGKTFNKGIYRVYRDDQIAKATESMKKVFPELSKRIVCFGYDWLGRNFAVDIARKEDGKPLILLLEPGAGESMQIPVSIINFHNDELVNYAHDALAINFFKEWQEQKDITIQSNQCVGYKIPLFLGGSDTVDNLELMNMDVYIHICGQLRNKAIELPNGMTIRDISID